MNEHGRLKPSRASIVVPSLLWILILVLSECCRDNICNASFIDSVVVVVVPAHQYHQRPASVTSRHHTNHWFMMTFSRSRSGTTMPITAQNTHLDGLISCHSNNKKKQQLRRRRRRRILSAVRSDEEENDEMAVSDKDEIQNKNRLDLWLSRLTTAFPLFVASAAWIGWWNPSALLWVNHGNTVTIMLAAVMCGTGLTLQAEDFQSVWKQSSTAVPLGVIAQFAIMPSTAWAVGQLLLKPQQSSIRAALFLGLIMVGCSPGGTASNLVSLIANADVALSVILTACSTMVAVFMTPLLAKLLVGSSVQVSGWALCAATAKVILAPVVGGMFLKARAPRLAKSISRFTPFASVLLVSLICGGVVAQTAPFLSTSSVGIEGVSIPLVVSAVMLLHGIGFAAGYVLPKILSTPESVARTISIEVGMQNSALAVVLARSIPGVHPAASLPGALSATAHSCIGSCLAAIWRRESMRKKKQNE